MRLHILGSAAAEGWPAVWCNCTNCERARAAGGKNIRTRSGALVDGVIKLDLCPDTFSQALRDGVNLAQVTDLLITHAHFDHLSVDELRFYVPPFAHDNKDLHIWGSHAVIDRLESALPKKPQDKRWLHRLEPLVPVTLADGTFVMPLPAKHAPASGPLNYVLRRKGRTLFYGLDSGWYPDAAWQAHSEFVFDIAVLDCTGGGLAKMGVHGNVKGCRLIRETMLQNGTATNDTVFIANHFSHNGGLLHEELEDAVGEGILVGYDGMVVEV